MGQSIIINILRANSKGVIPCLDGILPFKRKSNVFFTVYGDTPLKVVLITLGMSLREFLALTLKMALGLLLASYTARLNIMTPSWGEKEISITFKEEYINIVRASVINCKLSIGKATISMCLYSYKHRAGVIKLVTLPQLHSYTNWKVSMETHYDSETQPVKTVKLYDDSSNKGVF